MSSPTPGTYIEGGCSDKDIKGYIGLPPTVHENLSTKPTAQKHFLELTDFGLGPLPTDKAKRDYLNFYGNLMVESDQYLVEIMDKLDRKRLLDNTLVIYTSDHGEMGMSHNGQRQKCFNFYEETLRVPLVFSNRKLFRAPRRSPAMVSHVDFLPTLAGLFDVPASARANWEGVDYSRLVLDAKAKSVQDYVVFTYDDFQVGQPNPPYVPPPNHITSIREERYKLAKYYDTSEDNPVPEQWEMYDLQKDPNEVQNIAYPDFKRTKQQEAELARRKAKLAEVERTRLQPL